MMRKLAIALSLVSAMGTGTAAALGLGEATVKSALNQPLSAEIELVNIRDLEQNEILPGLASREEFSKANIERVFLLSNIRFDIVKNDQGNSVIRLSTKKPIREPFLNFLVEVIWPSGRLLREYALLIDPPVFSEDQASSIIPTTVTVDDSEVQVPDVYGNDVASSSSSTLDGLPPIEVVGDSASSDTYGPTIQSDTLWAIALKVRQSRSMTPQQVMLAIQDNNPDAFVNGNINRLKAGYVLRLPSEEEISQRSVRQAVNTVVSQNRALEEGRSLAKRTIDATGQENSAQVQQPDSGQSGEELKIVVADSTSGEDVSGTHAGSSSQGGGTSTDLSVAMETLDKSERENEELNSRVKDLEDQLQTLQRLLTLKDDQLSELQGQMGKVDELQTEAAENAMSEMPANSEEMAGENSAEINGGDTVTDAESAVVDGESVSDQAMTDMAATDGAVEEGMAMGEAQPPAAEKIKPKQIVKTPPKPEPVSQQESLLDTITGNPLYWGGLGAGALLLILGLVALSRHNAQKEQAFHESLGLDDDDEDVFELERDDANDDDEDDDASDVGGDEAEDPISEADVYIAYGRLDQAASVLETGISAEPSRTDIRLKLLDVYKQSDDQTSFFKQFKEVEALDDAEALSAANELKAGWDQPEEDELDISIDDLEKDLLTGGLDSTASETSYDEADTLELDSVNLDSHDSDAIDTEELSLDAELDQVDELGLDTAETLEDDFASLDLDVPEDADALSSDSNTMDLDSGIDLEDLDKSLDDLDSELSGLDAELDDDLASLESDLGSELDSDLGAELADLESGLDDDLASMELSSDDADLAELDSSLDDDLGLDLSDELEEALAEDTVEESLPEDDLSLDDLDAELDADLGDLDLETGDTDEIDGLVEDLEEVASDLSDDDLDVGDSLDASLDVSDELEELELDESLDGELEGLELDSGLDAGIVATPGVSSDDAAEESDDEDDEDFDFLSGTDEAATKLDLARAYIDMGDNDGAKDILEEVTLEGNDDQKNEAKSLLKDLD